MHRGLWNMDHASRITDHRSNLFWNRCMYRCLEKGSPASVRVCAIIGKILRVIRGGLRLLHWSSRCVSVIEGNNTCTCISMLSPSFLLKNRKPQLSNDKWLRSITNQHCHERFCRTFDKTAAYEQSAIVVLQLATARFDELVARGSHLKAQNE